MSRPASTTLLLMFSSECLLRPADSGPLSPLFLPLLVPLGYVVCVHLEIAYGNNGCLRVQPCMKGRSEKSVPRAQHLNGEQGPDGDGRTWLFAL